MKTVLIAVCVMCSLCVAFANDMMSSDMKKGEMTTEKSMDKDMNKDMSKDKPMSGDMKDMSKKDDMMMKDDTMENNMKKDDMGMKEGSMDMNRGM